MQTLARPSHFVLSRYIYANGIVHSQFTSKHVRNSTLLQQHRTIFWCDDDGHGCLGEKLLSRRASIKMFVFFTLRSQTAIITTEFTLTAYLPHSFRITITIVTYHRKYYLFPKSLAPLSPRILYHVHLQVTLINTRNKNIICYRYIYLKTI